MKNLCKRPDLLIISHFHFANDCVTASSKRLFTHCRASIVTTILFNGLWEEANKTQSFTLFWKESSSSPICHHVKDAQSIDKFCWVSKWHRTNNGQTIIFWTGVGVGGGGGWKILTCKHFFFKSGWLLQTIYFKIFQPSPPSQPPPSKNNGPSLMAKKKKNYCAK